LKNHRELTTDLSDQEAGAPYTSLFRKNFLTVACFILEHATTRCIEIRGYFEIARINAYLTIKVLLGEHKRRGYSLRHSRENRNPVWKDKTSFETGFDLKVPVVSLSLR
jgi:hypothetical protein